MQTQVPAQQTRQNKSEQHMQSQALQPQFEDNRPEAAAQLRVQSLAENSPRITQLKTMQIMMAAGTPVRHFGQPSNVASTAPLQRMEEEEPLQAVTEEPVQREQAETPSPEPTPSETPKPNNTGLPNQLKAGIESLSGMSMDHVKVHYNSDKPAQLQAHAYAQGSEIHVAPGQEQHLPHEAWHVVQQAQGRVRPTVQMKMGVPVNDDVGLEAEADLMGAKALGAVQMHEKVDVGMLELSPSSLTDSARTAMAVIQRRFSNLQRGQLGALPQVLAAPNAAQAIDYLRDNTNRSADDIITLAGWPDGTATQPTLTEIVGLTRFANADILTLAPLPQIGSWAHLVALAALQRSVPDLMQLAQVMWNGARPTLPEIAAVDRFGNVELANLSVAMAPRAQAANWGELAQLGPLTRSAADLMTLSAGMIGGRVPSRPEIIAVDRFSIGELNQLVASPTLAAGWQHLAVLGPLARNNADLITLSGLVVNAQNLSAAQMVTLDVVPLVNIQALHNPALPQVASCADLVQLALLQQPPATTRLRASHVGGGAAPTLAELLTLDDYQNAEISAVTNLGATTWAQATQNISTVQATLLAVVESMNGTLGGDLAQLNGWLGGLPANALWHYKALLVDIDHTTPALDQGSDRIITDDYLRNSSFNACFDGAARLVDLMGSEAANIIYTSGGAAVATYAQAVQAARAITLGQHFLQAAAAGVPTLFRIHLGGHGFTLTVEHNRIYQVETLAGAGDAGTLLQSIENGYVYTIANCTQHFADMTSNNVGTRTTGAGNMGWNAGPIAILQKSNPAGPYDQVQDPMVFWWTASNLLSRDQIVQAFAQKIANNRLALHAKIQ